MNLSVSEIKEYVKNCLDEYSTQTEAELVTSDGAVQDLDRIIENAIVPAVRKIHLDAPNVLLTESLPLDATPTAITISTPSTSALVVEPLTLEFGPEGGTKTIAIFTEGEYSITAYEGEPSIEPARGVFMYEVTLPERFLRLVSLKMSDWTRPIQTLINEDSVEYRKQKNKYLMGTPLRPIGALVRKAGRRTMELYTSTSNGASIDYGYYIPEPSITDESVWVSSALEYPCLNQITAEVFRSIGEYQKAVVYENKAVQPFYIDPDYARLNPPQGERINTTNQ